MKNLRRILVLLCAAALMFSLAACGGQAAPAPDSPAAPADGGNEAGGETPAKEEAENGDTVNADTVIEAPPEEVDTRLDYGWIKFEMPEGYEDMDESDSYLTIRARENKAHVIKVFRKTAGSKTAAELAAEEVANSTTGKTLGEPVTVNGRVWHTVNFEFNHNPSVILFTEAYDRCCIKVTAYEMTVDEPALQLLLSNVELVPEE